ncbi:hypothetical protein HDU98_000853 [Podochytrium sp. JEL0797]|nr:hypothetical protein HDU98_000853 [Podochytrium sp. JEL0797]
MSDLNSAPLPREQLPPSLPPLSSSASSSGGANGAGHDLNKLQQTQSYTRGNSDHHNLNLLVQSIPRSPSGDAAQGESLPRLLPKEKPRQTHQKQPHLEQYSQFQQSLKLKEQQQQLIESRLLSPKDKEYSSKPLQPVQQLARLNMPKHASLVQTPDGTYYSQDHAFQPPQSATFDPRSSSSGHYHPQSPSALRAPPNSAYPSTSYHQQNPPPQSSSYHQQGPPPSQPQSSYAPPQTPQSQSQSQHSYPPPTPSSQHQQQQPPLPARRAFLHLFESIYDTAAEDLPRLVTTLKDQMRKSSSLLQTLQASGQMIEGLVRSCFRDMQVQYGEKFGEVVKDLERRLEVLERKVEAGIDRKDESGVQDRRVESGVAEDQREHVRSGQFESRGPSHDFTSGPSNPMPGSATPGSGQKRKFHDVSEDEGQDMTVMLKRLVDRIEQLEKKR